ILSAEEHEPANRNIESPLAYSLGNFDNTINVESLPLEARPLGRKAAKRAKRQASMEAHSAIAERVATSLEEMCKSSSVGWQRANDIHEDNKRFSQTRQKILILNDRIVMENLVAKAEKELYDLDPSAFGSPSDKAKRVVEMKNTILALRAQGDELIKSLNTSSSTSTSAGGTATNLESRYDEEGIDGIL
ncbi:hypothetical protein Droror1_Dr00007779, partial [Drosera rotundifolia]